MGNNLTPEELLARYALLSDEEKARVTSLVAQALDAEEVAELPPAQAALDLIDQVELFGTLNAEEREAVARRLEAVAFNQDAFIVQEGATDNSLYLLASGRAEVRVLLEGSNVTKAVATLEEGSFFGEMALLTGEPRRASVVALTPVACFRLGKEAFDELLRHRPEIVEGLSAILARRLGELREIREGGVALLESLPEEERLALLILMREVTFAPGDVVVRQGDTEGWMGFLISGEAEVRVEGAEGGGPGSRSVSVLRGGDVFGEMSLLSGEPRSATIIARTRVDGYVLDRDAFAQFEREFPQVRERLETIIRSRTAELGIVKEGLQADERRRETRESEMRMRRRIRRFFSLDLPAAAAERLRASTAPRVAQGRVLFEFPTPSGEDKPLHNMYLELWHRDLVEVFLGCATSARDGTFEVWYDPAPLGGKANLQLRIFENHHTFSRQGELRLTDRHIFTAFGDKAVEADRFDFEDVRVPYWEYDPNNPMPRALISDHGDPPQSYSPGRNLLMLKVVAPVEVIKRKHLLENRLRPSGPSLERIQREYPENLTRRLERERPGYTRTDEYFGERMLNGMSATVFDGDDSHPGRFRIYHHWNSYEQNGEYALPNVDMRFEIRDDRLFPTEIILNLREPGAKEANSPTERLSFKPGDGEKWEQAKRVARVSAALVAELDNHLTTTHLNTEQYTIAAYRNFRKNPLRFLLFPHLKEVVLIDHLADTELLGPTGFVTRAQGLTPEATKQRVAHVMGMLDWKNWRPIQPICGTHDYARVANLFWQVVTEYVDDFFEEYEEGITEHWYEVRMFSQDLVEHSAPDFLCRFLTSSLVGKPAEARAWFTPEERMDLSIPRYVVGGVPRAVQPVTHSDIPLSSDIENMKQVCRYSIYHATFKHTWANARQYDDAGEIFYAGLGIRHGDNGVLSPESDLSVSPAPREATEQLWLSYMLAKAVYGYILRNEDNDIHPSLLERLENRRAEFAALDFDIDTIQSRTNI